MCWNLSIIYLASKEGRMCTTFLCAPYSLLNFFSSLLLLASWELKEVLYWWWGGAGQFASSSWKWDCDIDYRARLNRTSYQPQDMEHEYCIILLWIIDWGGLSFSEKWMEDRLSLMILISTGMVYYWKIITISTLKLGIIIILWFIYK